MTTYPYLRFCRVCECVFRAKAKRGRICPNCHKLLRFIGLTHERYKKMQEPKIEQTIEKVNNKLRVIWKQTMDLFDKKTVVGKKTVVEEYVMTEQMIEEQIRASEKTIRNLTTQLETTQEQLKKLHKPKAKTNDEIRYEKAMKEISNRNNWNKHTADLEKLQAEIIYQEKELNRRKEKLDKLKCDQK